MSEPQSIVWWIKKDFRLGDNPALAYALGMGQPVIPVFIFEPSALKAPETSAFHVAAWLDGLKELRAKLRECGGDLVLLRGEVVEVLKKLHRLVNISELVSHEEIGSDRTYQRDCDVSLWCREQGVTWYEPMQTAVFRRLKDRDRRSQRWREWMDDGPLPVPSEKALGLISVPPKVMKLRDSACRRPSLAAFGFKLTASQQRYRQRVTESHARETMDDFLHARGLAYSGGISSPNTAFDASSRLSVHLAWGTITGREVYAANEKRMAELKSWDHPDAGKWRRSLNAFRSRLHWRDHFIQRLETEPTLEFHPINRAYEKLTFSKEKKRLARWCHGETGFPLVDACIRCAQTTGFLNFRMRCMITSVACHALRLNWQQIMWPMARWWADYEPGIHLAQLQMQAGVVGINSLRTYNPAKQIADHDPRAKFIKRWIPELRGVNPAKIIAHQDDPMKNYHSPVVNWKASTSEMRADYYAIRRDPKTKELAERVLQEHGSRKPPNSRRRKKSSR
ncbi:MAG: FAD-binding domain-containing protein [Lacipirellulaceae bacterium]